MEKSGSTPDQSLLDMSLDDFSDAMLEDIANERDEESVEQLELTLQQLEAHFGDYVFTYKTYSGTVRQLLACPVFETYARMGFDAATNWLMEHDGEVVEDIAAKELTDQPTPDVPTEAPKSDVEKVGSETTPNTNLPQTAVETPDRAADVTEAASPSTAMPTSRSDESEDQTTHYEDDTERSPDTSESERVELRAVEPEPAKAARVVELPAPDTITSLITEAEALPQVETEAIPENIANIDTIEQAYDTATLDDIPDEPAMESSVEMVQPSKIGTDDVASEINGSESIPNEGSERTEILEPDPIDSESAEIGISGDIDELDDEETVDTYVPVETTLMDGKHTEVVTIDSEYIDIPNVGTLAETRALEEDDLPEGIETEEVLSLPTERVLDAKPLVVDEVISEPLAYEATADNLPEAETFNELPPAAESAQTLDDFAAYVEEQPTDIEPAMYPVAVRQAEAVIKNVEILEQASSAGECHEAIKKLTIELETLLALLGYDSPAELAERLIARHDVASLKAYMALLVRSLQEPGGFEPGNVLLRTFGTDSRKYGSHAVQLTVAA